MRPEEGLSRHGFGQDAARFLLAGATNTLLSLLAYQLLLFVLPPLLAYAIVWVCGIAFVVMFYPSKVFYGSRTDPAARLRFGFSYAAIFFLGLAALHGLQAIEVGPRLAIVFVMAVTTIANFLLGRLLLRQRRKHVVDSEPF